jgi:predicted DNA-binding protein (MmcQ/YjbR family)
MPKSKPKPPDPEQVKARLLEFALSLPGTAQDHPWGETVVKTNGKKKIFVFLGSDDADAEPGISVKLLDSREQALQIPGAEPTGYGLGRAGWVSIRLTADAPPVEVLEDWVEESYRQVALKRLIKELDARSE